MKREKKLALLAYFGSVVALIGAMAVLSFAGTETPPLPQANDVLLSGEGFTVGTLTFTVDGETTMTFVNVSITTVTLQEPPKVFVEYDKRYRALTSEIDGLTTSIAGLNQLITEAEELIYAKETLLQNKQADLADLQSEQSVVIESPTIVLDGRTTATLRRVK